MNRYVERLALIVIGGAVLLMVAVYEIKNNSVSKAMKTMRSIAGDWLADWNNAGKE